MYEWTQTSLWEAMLQHGIQADLINELATAITRVNYGQNATLNGLAGGKCLKIYY